MRRLTYIVGPEDEGRQVQAVLKERLHMGRQGIRAAKFRENGIMLDDARVFTIDRVRAGQVLSIAVGDTDDALAESAVIATPGPLDIVFEDDDLIVLNKPAGVSTHPGPKHIDDTLGNYLMHYFQSTAQRCLLHPVQRLDWGTSGLIVFAKNAHAQDFLQKRLHTGDFCRQYIAFCQGEFTQLEGTIDAPIGCIGHTWQTAAVREGGKPARTHYRVQRDKLRHCLSRLPDAPVFSRIRLQLETGRTHQIRIHMSHIGHPLLGDPDHGGTTELIARPALHSAFLQVEHPVTGELMTFDAPLPPDLAALDAMLRDDAALPDDAASIET